MGATLPPALLPFIMAQLPPEIWLLIAAYLTDEELYAAISVDRFFFNLGMDKKWWNVHLEGVRDEVVKLLDRIE